MIQATRSIMIGRTILGNIMAILFLTGCVREVPSDTLMCAFNGGYGQVEIGGPYIGMEFHQSRPLPSRLSFYYPVANSLDLSTDYWQRHHSHPVQTVIFSGAKVDTLGLEAWRYDYAPHTATFHTRNTDYAASIRYRFGGDLPFVAKEMTLEPLGENWQPDSLIIEWNLSLRTSHAYRWVQDLVQERSGPSAFAVTYPDAGADSASLFFCHPAPIQPASIQLLENDEKGPVVRFRFDLPHTGTGPLRFIQLIGMCKQSELEKTMASISEKWEHSALDFDAFIRTEALERTVFQGTSPALEQTAQWAKAIQIANRHYIDGRIMPMPCPAEYNFFFTHDLLLTGLGVVNYDPDYIADGYRFLLSLTGPDGILPHAYYWRECEFVTEFCNSDNWNHLWIVISAASYLKHSGDIGLVDSLYPILETSIGMMLENLGEDGLMYAKRPDWWDIGNVYGPRAYITILMSKALHDFNYIGWQLGRPDAHQQDHLEIATTLATQLVHRLWDDQAGYLMNIMENGDQDDHFYTGSLLAVAYGLLDHEKATTLLETARTTLLDTLLGIRNAMPADFHELGARYRFAGNEAGDPWVYFNGGVWPHGNIWYVQALVAAGQVERAAEALRRYMTLDGISSSPNGLPAFYEYRRTNAASPRYGEIDKPTFLWAGGFYLQALYSLAGYRESTWNQYFDVRIPKTMVDAAFDLSIRGKLARVVNSGTGDWFEAILVDGKPTHSAVMTDSCSSIQLKRGRLSTPYLIRGNCQICAVDYTDRVMDIEMAGRIGQTFDVEIASNSEIIGLRLIPDANHTALAVEELDASIFQITGFMSGERSTLEVLFTDVSGE